jgi:hypothetical protein
MLENNELKGNYLLWLTVTEVSVRHGGLDVAEQSGSSHGRPGNRKRQERARTEMPLVTYSFNYAPPPKFSRTFQSSTTSWGPRH